MLLSCWQLSSRYRAQPWLPWPTTASLTHSTSASTAPPTIGLVIAHPDDETLFFLPTLLHLVSQPSLPTPHLLCLSTGDSAGLGRLRTEELLRATALLSLPPSHVLVVDDERLQDGLHTAWPLRAIQDKVGEWVRSRRVRQLVTFDQGGVSGHINHRAVHHAVSDFIYGHDIPAWELVSWPLWRKYLAVLGGWGLGGRRGKDRGGGGGGGGRVAELLLVQWDLSLNWRCMCAHWSQFVWYRQLFVLFSLYTTVNVLRRM